MTGEWIGREQKIREEKVQTTPGVIELVIQGMPKERDGVTLIDD